MKAGNTHYTIGSLLLFASLLPLCVPVAGSSESDRSVFVKKIGPGKIGTLATAGLGYMAVQAPLKGLQGAAYSAGDAVDALSKGKICDAVGHTIMAPVNAAAGAVVGAGALIASPFPAVVGGGMAAFNSMTGSKKGTQTLRFHKQTLKESLQDPKTANKAKFILGKKDMERLYAQSVVGGSSQQSEKLHSGSSFSGSVRSSSRAPPGGTSSGPMQLQRSNSASVRQTEGSLRSGGGGGGGGASGSRPPHSQRPSSSVTSHGGEQRAVGSSASRPRSTTSSARSNESKPRSAPKSLSRSATSRHR